jgi:hypothetical protein
LSPSPLRYAVGIVTHEHFRREEAGLLARRDEAGERKDVESWENYNGEPDRVRRDAREA